MHFSFYLWKNWCENDFVIHYGRQCVLLCLLSSQQLYISKQHTHTINEKEKNPKKFHFNSCSWCCEPQHIRYIIYMKCFFLLSMMWRKKNKRSNAVWEYWIVSRILSSINLYICVFCCVIHAKCVLWQSTWQFQTTERITFFFSFAIAPLIFFEHFDVRKVKKNNNNVVRIEWARYFGYIAGKMELFIGFWIEILVKHIIAFIFYHFQ